MSYEAWGDDDADRYDHLIDAGWWTDDQTKDVVSAIKALRAEQLYEDGDKAKGVSPRFLMRLTILSNLVGLLEDSDPLVREAEAALFPEKR